ncbi:Molybdopterin synthase catalytic subunit [Serratia odorifera]|uniref:Molybdopterin synthase catalytic subunit n=1 Tax=Serratia odorifera TaxID=618 RepID=A0A447L2F1_SEROD|nr:molybdopterin synthase catalytic subunit MoaE [Serratia odorifera]VDZ65671.1 Molybdopterin synthase catalytic subunit [Serratia odorifera]
MENTRIRVGSAPFGVGEEYQWLAQCDDDGAVVTFTGKVRNHNLGADVSALTLEHYPGMTEKALTAIVVEARERWPLQRVSVIHRVGELFPGDENRVRWCHQRTSQHGVRRRRIYHGLSEEPAAPFWKREATGQG